MSTDSDEPEWLTSSEVRKRLKISTCELAHRRNDGHIRFKKQGNAYLYLLKEACDHPSESAEAPPHKGDEARLRING